VGGDLDISEPLSKRQKLKDPHEMDDFVDLQSLPAYPTPTRQRRSLAVSRLANPPALGLNAMPEWAKMI
jgi:hypothetical protein